MPPSRPKARPTSLIWFRVFTSFLSLTHSPQQSQLVKWDRSWGDACPKGANQILQSRNNTNKTSENDLKYTGQSGIEFEVRSVFRLWRRRHHSFDFHRQVGWKCGQQQIWRLSLSSSARLTEGILSPKAKIEKWRQPKSNAKFCFFIFCPFEKRGLPYMS